MSRGYTRPMKPIARSLLVAAVLVTLAGCGNKGPLVLPDAPAADVAVPTQTPPPSEPPPPGAADPGGAVPPVAPPPPVDDGGHG